MPLRLYRAPHCWALYLQSYVTGLAYFWKLLLSANLLPVDPRVLSTGIRGTNLTNSHDYILGIYCQRSVYDTNW